MKTSLSHLAFTVSVIIAIVAATPAPATSVHPTSKPETPHPTTTDAVTTQKPTTTTSSPATTHASPATTHAPPTTTRAPPTTTIAPTTPTHGATTHAPTTTHPSRCGQCWPQVCDELLGACVNCTREYACDVNSTCKMGYCEVKDDAKPFKYLGAAFAVLGTIIVCSIAAVAGVGGGGILVPLYCASLGLPMTTAVSLSQAAITGMSVLSVGVKLRMRHPVHDRPIINWTLMTFWLPCSLAGTLIGNLIGKTVPDWFRIVLLLTLLSYVLYRVVSRARAQRRVDSEKQSLLDGERQRAAAIAANADNKASVNAAPPAPAASRPGLSCGEIIPAASAALIAFTFLPLMLANYATSKNSGWTVCNTDVWWAIMAGAVVYNFAMTTGVRVHLRRVFLAIATSDLDDVQSEQLLPFKWNRKTSILFPLVAITAGGAASLLGIGGGLILGVLFLEAGLMPEEVSATSGCATLLVAAESLSQFVIQEIVPLDYGIMCIVAGLISALVGQFVLVREIKRRGWSFLIIVALGFIMGGSMVALTADGIYSTVTKIQNHESLGFTGVCK